MKLLLIAVAAIAIVLSVEKAYGFGIPSQVTILAGSSEPNTNHFEKYLPEFEQIVKTFKFVK